MVLLNLMLWDAVRGREGKDRRSVLQSRRSGQFAELLSSIDRFDSGELVNTNSS